MTSIGRINMRRLTTGTSPSPHPSFDPEDERRAVRKLDYTILPLVSLFYLLSFLVNVSDLTFIVSITHDIMNRTGQTLVCLFDPNGIRLSS